MREGDAVITCDWAMKFLPRRYREGQIDWFAKRGINWHVSVSLYRSQDKIQSTTHIHIFDHQVSQDAPVTAAVICDVVNDLTAVLPTLNSVHLFSDNAGCYKSSTTILTVYGEMGPKLKTYNFSEAQNGKGPCDRRASHAKSCIKRYVNEGHDVTTATDMKKALDMAKTQSVRFRVRVVDAAFHVEARKGGQAIQKISSFYNFKYEENGVRMWKAFNIGPGKFLPLNEPAPKCSAELIIVGDWGDVSFNTLERHEVGEKQKKMRFRCSNENCDREFSSPKALDDHIILGQCDYRKEKLQVADKAKLLYKEKLMECTNDQLTTKDRTLSDENDCYSDVNVQMGWGLKSKKKKTVFSEKQKSFLLSKFSIGKTSGCKADPYAVAEEMRCNGQFRKEHFLSAQQITSYFSRLSQTERKMDVLDLAAANEENKLDTLKREIISCLE